MTDDRILCLSLRDGTRLSQAILDPGITLIALQHEEDMLQVTSERLSGGREVVIRCNDHLVFHGRGPVSHLDARAQVVTEQYLQHRRRQRAQRQRRAS